MVQYRPDIDGLRAIAVVSVVLGHAGLPGAAGGYVGVDVFFVISGYLICSILIRELREERYSLITFYERRARRILPALFAVLATCLVAGWFWLPPPQYEALGWSAIAATLFVSNIWFWRSTGDYFSSAAEFEPLLHTWSLAVEEQFYIVFPLLLAAIYRLREKLILPLLVIACAGSLALSIWATSAHPPANFYLAPTRAWELGIGAFLALGGAPQLRSKLAAEVLALAAALAIGFAIVSYTSATPFPGLAALPPVLGTAALIWIGSQHQTLVTRLLSTRPFVWIGLISYSLYLWHWPALVLARSYVSSIDVPFELAAVAILASFVLAWLTWRFVERPFRARGANAAISKPQIFAFSAIGAAAIVAASGWIGSQAGLWSRAPNSEQEYLAASTRSALELQCEEAIDQTNVPCVIGDESAFAQPHYLVWGDSHVGAMIPGVDQWLKARGEAARVFFYTGCLPVSGIDRLDIRGDHDCSGANARTLSQALDDASLQHVVLAGRWPLWVTGDRPEGETGTQIRLGDAQSGQAIDKKDYAQAVQSALAAHVKALRAKGLRVTVLSPVPEPGYDPARLFVNAQFLARQPELIAADAVRAREASSVAMLDAVAAENGAQMIRISDHMCRETCATFADDKLLYRDDDHLSDFGARWLMPRVLDEAVVEADEQL